MILLSVIILIENNIIIKKQRERERESERNILFFLHNKIRYFWCIYIEITFTKETKNKKTRKLNEISPIKITKTKGKILKLKFKSNKMMPWAVNFYYFLIKKQKQKLNSIYVFNQNEIKYLLFFFFFNFN